MEAVRLRLDLDDNSCFHEVPLLVSMFAALQFLTIIPPLISRPFTAGELGRSVAWYPAVGLLLGTLLWLLNTALAALFPSAVNAALVVTAWLILTRVLHFDGFLDACDGIFGGFSADRRLAIMRDSHVGAFAVAGGVLLLLLKVTALQALESPAIALLLAPTFGRWAISLLLISFPYGRRHGLGRTLKDNARASHLVLAASMTLLGAILIGAYLGLAALLLATVTTLLAAVYLMRLLPGITGDLYGAACELIETIVLLFFVAYGG